MKNKTIKVDAEQFNKAIHALKKTLSNLVKEIAGEIDDFYEAIVNNDKGNHKVS